MEGSIGSKKGAFNVDFRTVQRGLHANSDNADSGKSQLLKKSEEFPLSVYNAFTFQSLNFEKGLPKQKVYNRGFGSAQMSNCN